MDIQTSDQTPDQLEDKLRTMILGNVKNVSIPLPQRFPRNTPQLRINREPLPRKAQAQNVQDKGPYAPRKQHIQQSSGGPAQIQQPIQVAHRRPRMPPDAQQGQLNLLARQGQLPLARSSNYLSAPSKFQPLPRPQQPPVNVFNTQCSFLQHLAVQTLPGLHITVEELAAKDSFRCHLQEACQGAITMKFPLDKTVVSLAPFGSVGSGFAMPGSDMDLVMLLSSTEPYLPRLFEKALLDMGYGARLLTRTRVPIIKVCEKPQPELYAALCKERRKWDNMTAEEQEEYDHPNRHEDDTLEKDKPIDKDDELDQAIPGYHKMHALDMAVTEQKDANNLSNQPHNSEGDQPIQGGRNEANMQDGGKSSRAEGAAQETQDSQKPRWRRQKQWYRERHLSPLDFPKAGIGIQCDINFSNSLGIYNTLLLRCYSHCDPRVKPMVLFVKAWASRRKINSGYNNTLSSYGYVLMVLHFLVNVAQPPVCPNLQLMKRTGGAKSSTNDPHAECEGYDVRFWRDEAEIQNLAGKGMWRHNRDTLGMLLRNFFLYYARQGYGVVNGGFDWTRQVLSLRTKGGLLSKEEKGWTGAKMTVHDNVGSIYIKTVLCLHIYRWKSGKDIFLQSKIRLSSITMLLGQLPTTASSQSETSSAERGPSSVQLVGIRLTETFSKK